MTSRYGCEFDIYEQGGLNRALTKRLITTPFTSSVYPPTSERSGKLVSSSMKQQTLMDRADGSIGSRRRLSGSLLRRQPVTSTTVYGTHTFMDA
ncbi:hypothetical protein E2C01_079662 [Portunus trituberculatus]|uniref:Uncharacterized protein n=1 Tax=Portunus trituberculatus TaxID=210409 RepID=A0A5B7IHH2_PORTR|nr:hypothetical protein [Portunus trituberculatus]